MYCARGHNAELPHVESLLTSLLTALFSPTRVCLGFLWNSHASSSTSRCSVWRLGGSQFSIKFLYWNSMLFSCALEHDAVAALSTATQSLHPDVDGLGSKTDGDGQPWLLVAFSKGLALSTLVLTVTSTSFWAGFRNCFSLAVDVLPCPSFLDNRMRIMLPIVKQRNKNISNRNNRIPN